MEHMRILLVLLLVPFAMMAGCIFDTREANPPGGVGSTWQVPDFPSKVFLNLESGLEELTGTNYERSLNEIFTFVPLPEDANNLPGGAFDDWSVDVEMQVVRRLLADANKIAVNFTDLEQIRNQTGFADFQGFYDLSVIDRSIPPDTVIYKGKAQFDFQEGSKGWQMVRWEDLERVTNFASWGFLRGSTREL
jgi:hypothetical protein